MGRAQSDTYSSLFNKSDNVNVDETFVRKSGFVHVLNFIQAYLYITITYMIKLLMQLLINISSSQ